MPAESVNSFDRTQSSCRYPASRHCRTLAGGSPVGEGKQRRLVTRQAEPRTAIALERRNRNRRATGTQHRQAALVALDVGGEDERAAEIREIHLRQIDVIGLAAELQRVAAPELFVLKRPVVIEALVVMGQPAFILRTVEATGHVDEARCRVADHFVSMRHARRYQDLPRPVDADVQRILRAERGRSAAQIHQGHLQHATQQSVCRR